MHEESFEAFVARINRNAFLLNEPLEPGDRISKKRKRKHRKKSKLERDIEHLDARGLDMVLSLLDGTGKLITIEETAYVIRYKDGIAHISAVQESHDYVVENGRCTCPDSKFRERECKHVEAVRAFTEGGMPPKS